MAFTPQQKREWKKRPEVAAKIREYTKQWKALRHARIEADPVFALICKLKKKACEDRRKRRHKERMASDPIYAEKFREKARAKAANSVNEPTDHQIQKELDRMERRGLRQERDRRLGRESYARLNLDPEWREVNRAYHREWTRQRNVYFKRSKEWLAKHAERARAARSHEPKEVIRRICKELTEIQRRILKQVAEGLEQKAFALGIVRKESYANG